MFRRRNRNRNLFTAVFLIGTLAALWWGLGFADRERAQEPRDFQGPQIAPPVNERGEPVESPPVGGEALTPGSAPGALQLAIIADTEKNAAALLPGASTKEGIARFWFASDREVYVEYRRTGQTTVDRMAFLVASGDADDIALTRQSLYGMGDSGWERLSGEEVLFTKQQRDLYEKDASGNWVKRN